MDINTQISKYLSTTPNSKYNAEEIAEVFKNLADDAYSAGVFNYGEEVSVDEMVKYFVDANGEDKAKAKEDAQLLFDVLNAGSDDDVLTSDELQMITNQGGQQNGKIDGFSIWNQLYNVDVDEINAGLDSVNNDSSSEVSTETETEEDTSVGNSGGVRINHEQCAKDLYEAMKGAGTDEDTLESILYDPNISNEDFVQIVKIYEENYGTKAGGESLVEAIEDDTSGKLQTELTTALGQRLVAAAENGDEDAIDMLCKEIRGGTAEQAGTADDFLAAVFSDETSVEVISKISNKYAEVNDGADIVEDIKKDHGGFLGLGGLFGNYGKADPYIDKIQQSRRYIFE